MPDCNTATVQDLLTHLARLGVREFCVAAGARNAQIIVALQASAGIRIWSFFEERCAGFFALGRMLQDRAPVAVVTTSGTAAAELLPAVIEAFYQGVPLVVVTADRPIHYRGSGAPQAIEQPGLFGGYALPTLDVTGDVSIDWPQRLETRPLHVNVCLEEGISAVGQGIDFAAHATAVDADPSSFDEQRLNEFLAHEPLVLVAGLPPARASSVWSFLERLRAPVIAEATANLHGHPCVISGGEQQLAALNPRHVLRIGAVPSWRWWRDLEDRPDVAVLNLTPTLLPGLARLQNVDTLPLPIKWPGVAATTHRLPSPLPPPRHPPLSETDWIDHLARLIPNGARLFLGNSLPIREFNHISTTLHRDNVCYANRGANGIDGLVSTFLGISATSPESWIILGDLSALYDLAAPWILSQLPPGNRRIVVINNGGGKIFVKVASLRELPEASRAMIENRHTFSFAPWADLWRMPYRRATDPAQLGDLPDGPVLIEIVPS